ncbi:MAG: POT family MFS transporter [Cytophagaceae bacterium]
MSMPKGIPYIIGNELAERFSYYGMKTILTVFMTKYLMDSAGNLDVMTEEESKTYYHLFVSANYFFPILGALLSDILWGKYRTIIVLSIVYCLGHIALSLDETRLGLSLGLTMIAIGSGGIKPCVSANVGDQFDESNKSLLPRVFNYFYLSINLGAFASSLLTPILLRQFGPSVAFGIPGALMILATIIFWLGKSKYKVNPPVGWKKYKNDVFSKEGLEALKSLTIIYLFLAVFWSLYEQTGSSWVLQALDPHMIKRFNVFGFSFEILPDQVQALNPVLVLILVPFMDAIGYPLISKVFPLTSLRKISIGMFICALSFVIVAYMQINLSAGKDISILWQCLAYVILTLSEVMVYGTGLEFSYTQAPLSMKSLIMGFFLLSISLGSLFTAGINWFIQNPDKTSKLEGPSYFWFFVILMTVTSMLFIIVAYYYKEKAYVRTSEDRIVDTDRGVQEE